MSFRSHRSGKKHPITPKKTIYGPSKNEHLSEVVEQTSVPEARRSAETLEKEFRKEKTRPAKIRRWRAADLEAKRLRGSLGRTDLHRETRARLEQEAKIYQDSADRMHRELFE